jgi:hypothetical protein
MEVSPGGEGAREEKAFGRECSEVIKVTVRFAIDNVIHTRHRQCVTDAKTMEVLRSS